MISNVLLNPPEIRQKCLIVAPTGDDSRVGFKGGKSASLWCRWKLGDGLWALSWTYKISNWSECQDPTARWSDFFLQRCTSVIGPLLYFSETILCHGFRWLHVVGNIESYLYSKYDGNSTPLITERAGKDISVSIYYLSFASSNSHASKFEMN